MQVKAGEYSTKVVEALHGLDYWNRFYGNHPNPTKGRNNKLYD